MYRRFPDLEVEHGNGSVTKYNLEVSGPDKGKIEQIVVSNSPHNQGPPVHRSDLEIGQQIAKETGQNLKDVKMLVEQADGRYLYRTFREYQTGQTPEKPGETQRTIVDVNYEDRQGKLFTRKEVDKYLENAEIPHERRPSLDNLADDARRYDLSKEHFNEQHRPIEHER